MYDNPVLVKVTFTWAGFLFVDINESLPGSKHLGGYENGTETSCNRAGKNRS